MACVATGRTASLVVDLHDACTRSEAGGMSLNTTAVRIKVTLKDVKPEVMRCVVVPVTLRLHRLHLSSGGIGWTNSHLFEFLAGEGRWGIPDPNGDFAPNRSMLARRGSPISLRDRRQDDPLSSMTSATAGTMRSNSKNGSTTRR